MPTYPLSSDSETELRNLLSWQARHGIGPRFGERPIGWYQHSHFKAHDAIVAAAQLRHGVMGPFEVRVVGGILRARPIGSRTRWADLGPATSYFRN